MSDYEARLAARLKEIDDHYDMMDRRYKSLICANLVAIWSLLLAPVVVIGGMFLLAWLTR